MGWGGTHRSWPGGQGGKLRALVAGEGWGGRVGAASQKRGWFAVPKSGGKAPRPEAAPRP